MQEFTVPNQPTGVLVEQLSAICTNRYGHVFNKRRFCCEIPLFAATRYNVISQLKGGLTFASFLLRQNTGAFAQRIRYSAFLHNAAGDRLRRSMSSNHGDWWLETNGQSRRRTIWNLDSTFIRH